MRKNKLFGALAAGVAISVFGFAGTAHADPADDAAIIVNNLPAAVDALVAGVQEAADTLSTTQSAVETSADLGQALVDTGTALVTGTEQFAALGLGLLLVNLGIQNGLSPFLNAIDDPANAGDLVNPDDLATLGANLTPVSELVTDNLTTALVEGLQGNLVAPGFLDPATGTPALLGNILATLADLSTGGAAALLLDGTAFQSTGFVVPILVLVGGAAAGGFAGEYLQQVEDALAPVFDALAPVTAPIVEALQGV